MRLTFKYRLYPNDNQIKRLEDTFNLCNNLYNCALQERISFYRTFEKSRTYNQQSNLLSELKEDLPEYKSVYSQVLQSTLKRVDSAYRFFFKTKSGFPRFKPRDRFRSILYTQSGFSVKEKQDEYARLFLSKIGHIKMILHRRIIGEVKTCQIIKTLSGKWYVNLSCKNVPKEHLTKTNKSAGLDVGVKTYVTTSDGETIGNPKYLNKSKDKLKLAQQKFSKLNRKDSKRPAAKQHVARLHEKVKNQREDFQHKESKKLVERYDQIFCEDLSIKGMKSWKVLNRAIGDCAWGNFVGKISYKAERAGKILIKVDPRNTSQMCSSCGSIVPKELSTRIHKCKCGLVMDRDLNAAINIYNRGLTLVNSRESGITFSEKSRSPDF